MGHVITLPCIVKAKRTEIILNPEEDMRYLIDEYLGYEARNLFEEIIESYKDHQYNELGDDYESIADGYRNLLVSTMNALNEQLDKPRLSRKTIEGIYNDLDRNL